MTTVLLVGAVVSLLALILTQVQLTLDGVVVILIWAVGLNAIWLIWSSLRSKERPR